MNNNTIDKLNKRIKRYQISIVLLILICSALVVFNPVGHGEHYKPQGNFPLLDPARVFIDPENYIVNVEGLRDYLRGIGEAYPDTISIYYEQMNSGANIAVNKDLRIFPASLSKLVQAILITKKVEVGGWTWDKVLPVLPEDLSSNSGTLYQRIGDKGMTVEDLMSELLINSDNTAQNIFRHYLDVPDYVSFQNETGLQDLYNDKGFISAKEYTRILRILYTSSYLASVNSEKILDYMTKATFHDYLSQGVPGDVKFAHKYGENKEYGVFSDSGIVYVPGKPYMISVMIKGKDSSESTRALAVKLMKEISEHAYEASK